MNATLVSIFVNTTALTPLGRILVAVMLAFNYMRMDGIVMVSQD